MDFVCFYINILWLEMRKVMQYILDVLYTSHGLLETLHER